MRSIPAIPTSLIFLALAGCGPDSPDSCLVGAWQLERQSLAAWLAPDVDFEGGTTTTEERRGTLGHRVEKTHRVEGRVTIEFFDDWRYRARFEDVRFITEGTVRHLFLKPFEKDFADEIAGTVEGRFTVSEDGKLTARELVRAPYNFPLLNASYECTGSRLVTASRYGRPLEYFGVGVDAVTRADPGREAAILELLREYAQKTDNAQLLEHLDLVSDAVKTGQALQSGVEKLAEYHRSQTGRSQTRRGAGASLIMQAMLGAVGMAASTAERELRQGEQRALVELIEGLEDLNIEAYPIRSEQQAMGEPGGAIGTLVQYRLAFLDLDDTDGRLNVRKDLRDYAEREVESAHGNTREVLQQIVDTLDTEMARLRRGEYVEPGGRINIYYFLPVRQGIVDEYQEDRSPG